MTNGVTNPAASLSMLQINLNHCQLVQDLLYQNIVWMGAHVAIVSELYGVGAIQGWYTDHTDQVNTGGHTLES